MRRSPVMRAPAAAAAIVSLVLLAGACGGSGASHSAAPTTTTLPVIPIAVSNPADLCHKFTETLLNLAKYRKSDAVAQQTYRALAAGGTAVDAETSRDIKDLADAFATASETNYSYKVSSSTGIVLSRCRRLGFPLTMAERAELEQLLLSHLTPPTTTTTKPR